ncbi:formylglycine-generating enzyme family protein [Myxococcota bacterium]|nr:formylglycine-generating enzyme family protein [Myxococcota bacterium]
MGLYEVGCSKGDKVACEALRRLLLSPILGQSPELQEDFERLCLGGYGVACAWLYEHLDAEVALQTLEPACAARVGEACEGVIHIQERRDASPEEIERLITLSCLSGIATRCRQIAQADLNWIEVRGGAFTMGTQHGEANERPAHQVRVPTFKLTRSEVTTRQYSACVLAGVCSPAGQGANCPAPLAMDRTPARCVTWAQARRLASWLEARLPTEAEWEFAATARGQRAWPWGHAKPNCSRALLVGCGMLASVDLREKDCVKGIPCDLIGGVSEWIEDVYHGDYNDAPLDGSAVTSGSYRRVVRGGSYTTPLEEISATRRADTPSEASSPLIGIRLATRDYPRCRRREDCLGEEHCIDGHCAIKKCRDCPCKHHNKCVYGYICSSKKGKCIKAACQSDSDCPGLYSSCRNWRCVEDKEHSVKDAINTYRDFVKAFNQGNSYLYFQTYMNPIPCWYRSKKNQFGIEHIRKKRDPYFNNPGSRLMISQVTLQHASVGEVGLAVEGSLYSSLSKQHLPIKLGILMVHHGGRWRIAAEVNTNAPPPGKCRP